VTSLESAILTVSKNLKDTIPFGYYDVLVCVNGLSSDYTGWTVWDTLSDSFRFG